MTEVPARAESLAFSPTDDRLMVVGFGADGRWISVFDLAGASPPVQLDTTGVGFVQNVRLSGSAGIVAGTATDGERRRSRRLGCVDRPAHRSAPEPTLRSWWRSAPMVQRSLLRMSRGGFGRGVVRGRVDERRPSRRCWPASTPAVHWRFPRTVEPLPI